MQECAVIGAVDQEWGESVKAIVVLKQGEEMTSEEVIDHCKQHLAGYKKPKSVEFMDLLPRNAMGKVMKSSLRETYGKSISY